MSSRAAASRMRSLLRLSHTQWSAPLPQPQLSASGDALAALRFATSASPPADDAPKGKDYWRSLAERRLQGLKPDVETAAGLATAEAADPDAAVPIAEASPDAIMDAAGSDGPLEPAPRDAVVSDAAAPAVGPGPGLPSAAADDAAFEGVLKPETGAGAAGEAHAVAGSEALSLGTPSERSVHMDAVREVARRGAAFPYLQRLRSAQALLRTRRRDEGIPADPMLMADLKEALKGGREVYRSQRPGSLQHPEADDRDAAVSSQRPELLEPDSLPSATDAGIQLLAADAVAATARLDAAAARSEELADSAAASVNISELPGGEAVPDGEPDADIEQLASKQQARRQWRRPGLEGPNHADPEFGFAALGTPHWLASVPPSQPGDSPDGQPQRPRELRINPFRTFFPGQTYEPSELHPTAERSKLNPRAPPGVAGLTLPTNAEVMEQADFRNVPFIGRYMTPTGQLVPRRRTRLKQKVHRHLCRQIKLAKIMALVPVDRAPALPRQYRQRLQRGAPASDDGDGADSSQAPAPAVPAHLRWPRPPTVRATAALAEAYSRPYRRRQLREAAH